MRKRISGKKLSRSRTARDALYRSLVKALVEHGQITTTKTKAKALQRYSDQLITTAKKDTLFSRRRLLADLANDKNTADSLYKLSKSFKRRSGYTSVVMLPARRGDNASMAKIGWVEKVSLDEGQKKGKRVIKKKDKGDKKDTKK